MRKKGGSTQGSHDDQRPAWEHDWQKGGSNSDHGKGVDDKMQGGYPMEPGSDDPEQGAFGGDHPESHNTGPFKGK